MLWTAAPSRSSKRHRQQSEAQRQLTAHNATTIFQPHLKSINTRAGRVLTRNILKTCFILPNVASRARFTAPAKRHISRVSSGTTRVTCILMDLHVRNLLGKRPLTSFQELFSGNDRGGALHRTLLGNELSVTSFCQNWRYFRCSNYFQYVIFLFFTLNKGCINHDLES